MNKSILYIWQLKCLVKNIFITIVALTLLIGSSGFQVYKHTCSMHNFSAVSLLETPECEKDHQVIEEKDDCCKTEVEEIAEPSCCESEPIDKTNLVSFATQEFKCCISSFESLQIQDNLFPPIIKKVIAFELVVGLFILSPKVSQQPEHNLVLQNNNLPPPVYGRSLLTTLHQLKIDTPIC